MEKDDEVKGAGNSYDFGARIYDPRLGRWWKVDFFADNYMAWSPYSYSLGNPIFYIDMDGNTIFDKNGTEVKIEYHKDGSITILNKAAIEPDLATTIQDTWNESKTGEKAIKKLDKRRAKVMVETSRKFGIYQTDNGEHGKIDGITIERYSDETGSYKAKIYLFDTEGDPDIAKLGTDEFVLIKENDRSGKVEDVLGTPEQRMDASDLMKDGAVKGAEKHKRTQKAKDALKPDERKIAAKIENKEGKSIAFGRVTTLIHEAGHALGIFKNSEKRANKRERQSFSEPKSK